MTTHTQACIASQAEINAKRENYAKEWPNHCPDCEGWGGHSSSYDPSPDGVSLGGGSYKDLDLYRYQQLFTKGGKPKRNVTSIKSRYGTLVDLYGQRQANKIMRELEVKAWDLPGTK